MFSLGVVSLLAEVVGEVIVSLCRFAMVLATYLHAYFKGLAVKRRGFGVTPLGIKVGGEIVVASRRVWSVLAEYLLAYLKSLMGASKNTRL